MELNDTADASCGTIFCVKSCDSIAAVAPLSAHPGQTREEAFWRTLICNTVSGDRVVVGDRMSASYHGYMDLWRVFFEDEGGITEEYYVERAALSLHYDSAFGKTIRGRIFCRTKNGKMGMVLTASLPGDIVCAFMGASTPFVIRPKPDGCYQPIGEYYIHCMMQGEILQLPNFEERLEDIVLL